MDVAKTEPVWTVQPLPPPPSYEEVRSVRPGSPSRPGDGLPAEVRPQRRERAVVVPVYLIESRKYIRGPEGTENTRKGVRVAGTVELERF